MKWKAGWLAALLGGVVLVGAVGCKPDEAVRQGAVLGKGSKPASTPLDEDTLGSVKGTVRFAGKPPARIKIDMTLDPGCVKGQADNYTEQYVVHEGKLANVYIYVKSGPPAALSAVPTTPQAVVMDQQGCKYAPHVVAVMRGGTIEFRNPDPTMHNIHTLPRGVEKQVNVTQGPKGAPQTVQFNQSETMMPVRCDLHPWMNAFINIADTPFYAVTDADGNFEIENMPAGTYVIGAVHEKMGEQDITVTVKPHETSNMDYIFAIGTK